MIVEKRSDKHRPISPSMNRFDVPAWIHSNVQCVWCVSKELLRTRVVAFMSISLTSCYIYIYKEFHVSRTCLISLNAVACAANVEHEHGRSDQQVSHLRPLSYRWRYGQSRNYIVRSTPIHKGAVNVAAQTSVGPFRKSKDGVWRVPRHGQVGKLEWSASFSGWTIHANTSHNTWKKFNYGSQTCKTGIRLVAFKSSRKAVCV